MRYLIISLAFFGVVALLNKPVHAAQETQFTVSPVTFEFSANPGDTVTNQIKVTNFTNAAVQMETRVENISGTGDQGQVYLTEEDTKFALNSWVTTSPNKFSLGPKEFQVVDFTVQVPSQAEPGGHYGSVLVGTIASDSNTTGASVSQRVGSLLLVKVSGQAQEAATITGFRPKTYTGKWDEVTANDGKTKIFVARNEEGVKEKYLRYFQSGPLAFDLKVQNNGNVHVKPTGKIIIYNLINRPVAELTLDSRNIFPGQDRSLVVIWPQKKLWGIHYRAQLAAVYGSPNQALTASASFWAFPLPAAIGAGVVLLLCLMLRRRITRAFRILIKGA